MYAVMTRLFGHRTGRELHRARGGLAQIQVVEPGRVVLVRMVEAMATGVEAIAAKAIKVAQVEPTKKKGKK